MTTAPSLLDFPQDLQDLLSRTDVTVADVAHLPEDLRYELIDGRLSLTPSAFPIHNYVGQMTAFALLVGSPDDCATTCDQSVMLADRTELRPDVVVMELAGVNRSPVFANDVLLAVEVLSRSAVSDDRGRRCKAYAYAGIPSYWLIDPLGSTVTFTQFLLGDGGVYQEHLVTDEAVTVDVPWEVTLDLPAWTKVRDKWQGRDQPGI